MVIENSQRKEDEDEEGNNRHSAALTTEFLLEKEKHIYTKNRAYQNSSIQEWITAQACNS